MNNFRKSIGSFLAFMLLSSLTFAQSSTETASDNERKPKNKRNMTEKISSQNEAISQVYNFDISLSNVGDLDLDFDIAEASQMGKYYGLFIGIEKYQDKNIKSLDKPVQDARELRKVLTDLYSFELENTYLLENPNLKDILDKLKEISQKATPNDNVLIFYAGHGKADTKAGVGYWLPGDARNDDESSFFSNSVLRDYINRIDSKHTLVVADACFSGALFTTRSTSSMSNAPNIIKKMYSDNSRRAFTSTALTEAVDNSVFLEYIIRELRRNKDIYLAAENLYHAVKENVINHGVNQNPQYGAINGTKDAGGSFVFIRKK
jgi:hypothetical protein